MNNFYVYIYLDPRKPGQYNYGSYEFGYEPFYIGKGKDERWKDKKNDYCEYKKNKIKLSGLNPIRMKIIEDLEENYSFEIEKELIKLIGRENLKEGPLTNLADGGEGPSGRTVSEEELQKRRKEYLGIKNTFEDRKYKLLTKEKDYKNAHQKLEYIHKKCGNKHSISWNDFQQGKGCPVCGREEQSEKRRKYFPEIKNSFENIDWKLITEEKDYKNAHQKLEYECTRGHRGSISWSNFQQGKDCPKCYNKKRRKNFPEIRNAFENIDWKLRTEEKDYKNCKTKLEYECTRGHRGSITWNNFQQRKNNYCPKCSKEKFLKN